MRHVCPYCGEMHVRPVKIPLEYRLRMISDSLWWVLPAVVILGTQFMSAAGGIAR